MERRNVKSGLRWSEHSFAGTTLAPLLALGCLATTACAAPQTAEPAPNLVAKSPPNTAPSPLPEVTAPAPPTLPIESTQERIETAFESSTPELARFHAALHALEKGRRTDHVRVLWFGDSHGQADFWSGELRKLLGERFGKGGPGFLHLGYKNYRHDGVKLDVRGKWRMRPKRPVHTKRQADGVYGLGGLMMSGYQDMPRVSIDLTDPIPGEKVKLDLCYRFVDEGDGLAYSIDGKPEVTLVSKNDERGTVRHLELEASSKQPLVVRPLGRTALCGVVVEADPVKHPGVVLDTLAINGARYGTALAWDEDAWTREVARRKPDLVVLEYGTNEAGDTNPAYEKVGKQMGELLARVRKVSANVECVVVSPTDRADAETRVTRMRETLMIAAKKEGCFWFDAWHVLGGEGSSARLSEESEPKVQADKIHLTIKGYREIGATMFDTLLSGYPVAASEGAITQAP